MLLLVSCANEDKQGSSGYGAINVQVSADYEQWSFCRYGFDRQVSRSVGKRVYTLPVEQRTTHSRGIII